MYFKIVPVTDRNEKELNDINTALLKVCAKYSCGIFIIKD